jgi:nucleotidyltransferase AbiEii toxin of type IV toxin-antitoxin system
MLPTHAITGVLVLMAEDPSGPRPVQRRFSQLVDALERVRADYAICGAVAMGAHGFRRFTEDIDVLIAGADLEPVVAALARTMRELGREPQDGPTHQVKLRSKRATTTAGVDIDLMVPVDAVEAWALATTVRANAFDRKVDVASLEALVVMKLRAYLSDPETAGGAKHRADAFALLELGRADVAALRQLVRTDAAMAGELDRMLAAPRTRGRL